MQWHVACVHAIFRAVIASVCVVFCMYSHVWIFILTFEKFKTVLPSVTQSILFHGVFRLSTLSHFSTVNRITSYLPLKTKLVPSTVENRRKVSNNILLLLQLKLLVLQPKIQTSNTYEHVKTANLGWQKINSGIVRIFFMRICCVFYL